MPDKQLMPRIDPKRRIDPFSIHEALDRAHLIASVFDDFIAEHPFVRSNADLRRRAERIGDQLGDLYQAVGRYAFPDQRQPEQLAKELGINAKTLREFLRKRFPRATREKNARWLLTDEQIAIIRQRWTKSKASKFVPRRDRINRAWHAPT